MSNLYLTDEDIHGCPENDTEILLRSRLDKANERIEELEQEKQELKQKCDKQGVKLQKKCDLLDEIREYIEKEFYTIQGVIVVEPDDIKEILDKVNNEN